MAEEYETYVTAGFHLEGGFYTIEDLEYILGCLRLAKDAQDATLAKAMGKLQ